MKISYNGMWPGFDAKNNWFNAMFTEYFNEPIEFSSEHHGSDLILSSVFGPTVENHPARRIFYSGETRVNGSRSGDILLTFDNYTNEEKFFRLPIWYLYMNWWKGKDILGQDVVDLTHNVNFDELMNPSIKTIRDFESRNMFCSMVVTNPTDNRRRAFEALSNVERIDGYGMMFNNHYPYSKIDIIRNYKFNVCFENTVSKGYVTEKLFEAKIAGCIPIYWGDSYSAIDFNPQGFIDFTRMNSYDDLVSEVRAIYSSNDRMAEMVYEPVFNEVPSLAPLFDFFDRIGLK